MTNSHLQISYPILIESAKNRTGLVVMNKNITENVAESIMSICNTVIENFVQSEDRVRNFTNKIKDGINAIPENHNKDRFSVYTALCYDHESSSSKDKLLIVSYGKLLIIVHNTD